MDGPALLKVAFECISPSGTNSVQCFSRTLFITHASVIPEVFIKLVQKMSGHLIMLPNWSSSSLSKHIWNIVQYLKKRMENKSRCLQESTIINISLCAKKCAVLCSLMLQFCKL